MRRSKKTKRVTKIPPGGKGKIAGIEFTNHGPEPVFVGPDDKTVKTLKGTSTVSFDGLSLK